jgi:hypothetical protein
MTEPTIDNPEVFIYRDVKFTIYVNPKAVGLAPDSWKRMERRNFQGIWLIDYVWPEDFKEFRSPETEINNHWNGSDYIPHTLESVKSILTRDVDEAYNKKQWHDEVKANLRKRLKDGIYGIIYGAKTEKFIIEPYQLEEFGFEADKVERLCHATETQNIGAGATPLVFNCKGYDAVLIGLGDD